MCLIIKQKESYFDEKFLLEIPESIFTRTSEILYRYYAIKTFRTNIQGRLISPFILLDSNKKYYTYKLKGGTHVGNENTLQDMEFRLGVKGENRAVVFRAERALGFHARLGDEAEFERTIKDTFIYRNRPKKRLPSGLLLLVRFGKKDVQMFDGREMVVVSNFYIPKKKELEKVKEFFNEKIKGA